MTEAEWENCTDPEAMLEFLRRGGRFAAWVRPARGAERGRQCALLRCVFGPLPFRAVAFDPAWLAWHEGTVRRLAEAIHEQQAFDRLPVLADALEESGCANADLLEHLRGPGPHVRGCWAVDLLAGRGGP
jgi:hypothetical protein